MLQRAELKGTNTLVLHLSITETATFCGLSRESLVKLFRETGIINHPETPNKVKSSSVLYVPEIGHLECISNDFSEDFYPTISRAVFTTTPLEIRTDFSGDNISVKLKTFGQHNFIDNYFNGINSGDYALLPRIFTDGKYYAPFVEREEMAVGKYQLLGFDLVYLPKLMPTENLEIAGVAIEKKPEDSNCWGALVDDYRRYIGDPKFRAPTDTKLRQVWSEGKVIGMVPEDFVIPMTPEGVVLPTKSFPESLFPMGFANSFRWVTEKGSTVS